MSAPLRPGHGPGTGAGPGSGPVGMASIDRPAADDVPLAVHLRTARSWGLAVLVSLTGLLAATGIALLFAYSPATTDGSGRPPLARAVQSIHLLAAWVAVFTAICTGVVVLIERGLSRRWFSASLGPLSGLVALSALVSGLLLPWNDVGSTAGPTGANLHGYWYLLRSDIRVVLTDYGPVSAAALTWNLGLHVVASASLALVAAMVWQLRHEPPTELTDLQRAERLARRRRPSRF